MSDIIGVILLSIALVVVFYKMGESIEDTVPKGLFYIFSGAFIALVAVGLPRILTSLGYA